MRFRSRRLCAQRPRRHRARGIQDQVQPELREPAGKRRLEFRAILGQRGVVLDVADETAVAGVAAELSLVADADLRGYGRVCVWACAWVCVCECVRACVCECVWVGVRTRTRAWESARKQRACANVSGSLRRTWLQACGVGQELDSISAMILPAEDSGARVRACNAHRETTWP